MRVCGHLREVPHEPARPRAPPSSLGKRFVLGSVFLKDALFPEVAAVLSPNDFSVERHRRIFARMQQLHTRGETIDRVTVAEVLKRQEQLESVEGLSYLAELDRGLPSIANIDSYVRIVKERPCCGRRCSPASESSTVRRGR